MPKKKSAPKVPPPKETRGPRGEGSVFFNARRGLYIGKVVVGKYPNGKTRYKEVSDPTHAGAVAKKKLVGPPDPDSVTVSEWAARWLAGLDVRPSTLRGYTRQLDARLLPTLGPARLADLTVSAVKVALLQWAAAGVPTANRTLQVAATMTQAAVLDGLVARNVFADCPRLKYRPKPLDPFTVAELRLLVANRHTTAADVLAFVAGTAVRIGEATALDVTDYNAAAGTVSITKTWTVDHGTREPKSKHGRRTLTVPESARPAVLRAIDGRTSGVLFRSRSGARFTNSQVFVALERVCEKLGLRPRGPHQIRHGVLTALVNSGAPLGDVAKFAGHSAAQLIRTSLHASNVDPGTVMEGILKGPA
jgi:integrase